MKNGFWLVVLMGLLLQGCGASSGEPAKEKKDPASRRVSGLEGYVVETHPLENNVPATGTLMPNEEVELQSEISGRIERISFTEGDKVRKGELLVRIDDSALQADLQKLNSQIKFAQKQLGRQTKLRKAEGVSEQAVEQAQTDLDQLKADRQGVKADINNSQVYAPFDGVVGLRMVSPGGFVKPGETIANLVQRDPIKVEFSVPGAYATQINKGTQVEFRVSGIDSLFVGEIYAAQPRIRTSTRMLAARARVPNPKGVLVPGMFADLKVRLDKLPDAKLIPTESVQPELGSQIVFVAKNGTMHKRKVRTGVREERMVQVLSGLQKGDTVLTTGLLGAKDGKAVKIEKVVNDQLWSPK